MNMECTVGAHVTQNLDGEDHARGHRQSAGGNVGDGGEHHRKRLLGGLQTRVICGDAQHHLQKRDAQQSLRGGGESAMIGELMHYEGRHEENGEGHYHREENVREDSDCTMTERGAEGDLREDHYGSQNSEASKRRPSVILNDFGALLPAFRGEERYGYRGREE